MSVTKSGLIALLLFGANNVSSGAVDSSTGYITYLGYLGGSEIPAISGPMLIVLGVLLVLVAFRAMRGRKPNGTTAATVAMVAAGSLLMSGFFVDKIRASAELVLPIDTDACFGVQTKEYPPNVDGGNPEVLKNECSNTVTVTKNTVDCEPGFVMYFPPSDSCDGGNVKLATNETCHLLRCVSWVEVVKTGDTISKATDDVTYQFTITNKAEGGEPDLKLQTISDTLLGDLATPANAAGCGTLSSGASCNFQVVRTVLPTDPDPLNNTVTVSYRPEGTSNDIIASDSHSVDLFHPAVEIVKTGETVSAVGQQVTYQFTITNKSDGDLTTAALDGVAPNLVLASITDSVLGSLATEATTAGCGTLPLGGSCNFTVSRTVLATDPDPLNNTVNVLYHPVGFPNNVTDSDSHSVDLFHPEVEIVKTGETISKATDDVTYSFTITNKSDGNLNTAALDGVAPNLQLATISDTLLGNLATPANAAGCGTLPLGASCNFQIVRTVLPTDPDPLNNTVNVLYHPVGFPNNVTDSDSHSVDLFYPDVEIVKTGDTESAVGQDVTYTFTITNRTDGNLNTAALDGVAPNLQLATISDTLLGNLATPANAAGCGTLPLGGSCNFQIVRTVLPTDPNPLNNTVNVLYHPAGFPNNVTDSDSHSVNIQENN